MSQHKIGGGDVDHLFKIVMIGNSGVGKSCMLMQYVEHSFTTNFFNTIGVDFVGQCHAENENVAYR